MSKKKVSSLRQILWVCFLGLCLACTSGCMTAYKESVGAEKVQVIQKIYLTDFNSAWQAVLEALKSARLDVSNREGGFIQTRWTDNTAEKNFADSFGSADVYMRAQYRFRVTAAKGFYNGQSSVKVTVQKEQVIQRDVLEGWRPVETDLIEENSLQYRIGRLIVLRMKLAKLEEQKLKQEMGTTPNEKPSEEVAPTDELPPPTAP